MYQRAPSRDGMVVYHDFSGQLNTVGHDELFCLQRSRELRDFRP
jgi:hypothetical protein